MGDAGEGHARTGLACLPGGERIEELERPAAPRGRLRSGDLGLRQDAVGVFVIRILFKDELADLLQRVRVRPRQQDLELTGLWVLATERAPLQQLHGRVGDGRQFIRRLLRDGDESLTEQVSELSRRDGSEDVEEDGLKPVHILLGDAGVVQDPPDLVNGPKQIGSASTRRALVRG